MGLLKLVIVDDEPILLEGLVKTYDWNGMGYEVVGFAQSGEQALKVIREKKPHVVLTDIRMKQISGLMVMEEIKKENPECQFVVLSAYRDFEYAKKACDLGALLLAISDFNVFSYSPDAAVSTVTSTPVSFVYSFARSCHCSSCSGLKFK